MNRSSRLVLLAAVALAAAAQTSSKVHSEVEVETQRHRAAMAKIDSDFTEIRKLHDHRLKECPSAQCKLDENKIFKQENARLLGEKAAEQALHLINLKYAARSSHSEDDRRHSAGAASGPRETGGAAASQAVNGAANGPQQTGAAAASQAAKQLAGFCSDDASCYTPARGPNCPRVRYGWGNCPDGKTACDWCYGPEGVFAYSPRASTYTLESSCNRLGQETIWSASNPEIVDWMRQAGGSCTAERNGVYRCANVNADRFREAANCPR